MAREKKETKEQEQKTVATRAEKKDAAKKLILEILEKGNKKASELIDEAAKLYAERLGGEDTENPNDVKGRIGSVLDVMKKEGEVLFDKGTYALKIEQPQAEKPKKTRRAKTKKAENVENTETPKTEEKPKKATKPRVKKEKKEEKQEEEIVQPVPPAPIMPIAPVVPVTPEVAPEPMPQEEKPKKTVKSRAKKTVKTEAQPQEEPKKIEIVETPKTERRVVQEKADEKKEEEKTEVKTVQEDKPKAALMDMSFLLGISKPAPKISAPAPAAKTQTESKQEKTESKEEKQEVKQVPQPQKVERAPMQKQEAKADKRKQEKSAPKKQTRTLTADEKLQEAFLSRLHRLGGNYFEYYSVYLLERYSRKNGRRLETLKITGGDHDGGIDGEIELTDGLGFRETIYIQAKNWDPDKGDEKLWVVGETLLQQFIGACVCRQAKDGKQNCRGIFITTSRFTAEARKILDDTADKFVGYDGADLYEAAKECAFGIVKKNGVFALDEELLSGEKAFFRAF